MAKKRTEQALTVKEEAPLPTYLTDFEGQTGLEGFTREDFKVPRLKLLQALNPEVQEHSGEAMPGHFWVSSAKQQLGKEVEFIICLAKRRVALWAPRGKSGGGILAMANDGIHWDKPNHEFEVELKGVGRRTYRTRNTVQESRLLEWGSSNPDDKNSQPAATLTYDYLCYMLPDGEYSPIVFSLYRTGVDTAKDLLSMLAATRRPIQAVKVLAKVREESRADGDFYMWSFKLNGLASEEQFKASRKIAETYAEFTAEEEDRDETRSNAADEKAF